MKVTRALTRLIVPVPGEALTSYIDRLAAMHKVDRLVMLQAVGMIENERYERMTGYGVLLDDERLERFSTATRLSRSVVVNMLLASYKGVAINLSGVNANAPDTLRRAAISEWAYFTGSHACPHCIREDQGAWQLAWKLPWSFACVKHKCYLVPYCPCCRRRLASGRRDRTLSPLFVRQVPKPGHCSNPQPDGTGRMGRSSRPCDHDLTGVPTIAACAATLCVQELLNECMSGTAPRSAGSQVSALEYFCDLRSLCAFILYCSELDDFGHLPSPEALAFRAFANERDHIFFTRQESATPRNGQRMRLVYARQESPELMAAVSYLATTILAAADAPSIGRLLFPLTERFIVRTRHRWAATRYFGFSSRLATVIEENIALRSTFDRSIGRHAVASREIPFSFESRHVPQLLWKDDFQQDFEIFFPAVYEHSARRFCAVALVKLCGNFTWAQSASELNLPTGAALKMASHCISILEETGTKAAFAENLRKVAMRLSKETNKIDYNARRNALSTLINIPKEHWNDICRAEDIYPGSGSRNRCATVWLWAELTGGDWRLAPGVEEKNSESFRDARRVLGKTIIPKLAPRLRLYGETLLQELNNPVGRSKE